MMRSLANQSKRLSKYNGRGLGSETRCSNMRETSNKGWREPPHGTATFNPLNAPFSIGVIEKVLLQH
jgi:hypothetical protein